MFVIALLLTLAPMTTRAQGELPPPVLDPADIFTDAVEVVGTLPILNADNDARMLWYFDPVEGEWRGYGYPDSIVAEQYPPEILQRADGTYAISEEGFYGFSEFAPEDIWLLNPDNRVMTHPEEACGRMKDLEGEGIWIVYENPENGFYHLCFTETGELSKSLPEEIQTNACDYWRRPLALSPNGEWVVFADCGFDPNPVSLYAYEIDTDTFTSLGAGSDVDNEIVEVESWLNNSTPVIFFSAIRNPSFHSIYVANVRQENSTQLVARVLSYLDMEYWPTYYDNPPRFEWVPSEHDRNRPNGREQDLQPSCQLHSYNLETRIETHYEPISGICGEGMIIPDGSGDRLYRSVNTPAPGYPEPSATATLIRFNPVTGERKELLTGEIEWLYNVSEDGTYTLLIIDNSGSVDVGESFTLSEDYVWWEWIQSPTFTIFDLTTNEFVSDATVIGEVNWIDDNRYISLDRLVTLDHNRFSEEQIGVIMFTSPDERRLFLNNGSNDLYAVSVLDIASGDITPIIRALSSDHFQLIDNLKRLCMML